jgi:hypothetical protein
MVVKVLKLAKRRQQVWLLLLPGIALDCFTNYPYLITSYSPEGKSPKKARTKVPHTPTRKVPSTPTRKAPSTPTKNSVPTPTQKLLGKKSALGSPIVLIQSKKKISKVIEEEDEEEEGEEEEEDEEGEEEDEDADDDEEADNEDDDEDNDQDNDQDNDEDNDDDEEIQKYDEADYDGSSETGESSDENRYF